VIRAQMPLPREPLPLETKWPEWSRRDGRLRVGQRCAAAIGETGSLAWRLVTAMRRWAVNERPQVASQDAAVSLEFAELASTKQSHGRSGTRIQRIRPMWPLQVPTQEAWSVPSSWTAWVYNNTRRSFQAIGVADDIDGGRYQLPPARMYRWTEHATARDGAPWPGARLRVGSVARLTEGGFADSSSRQRPPGARSCRALGIVFSSSGPENVTDVATGARRTLRILLTRSRDARARREPTRPAEWKNILIINKAITAGPGSPRSSVNER